ncbi:protein GLUTAMINE DUMPER 2-like [Typha latifolia]|uniref:protein GLUTAMINE DUMPER 2-like n=1 Tax=Typha latifolia TaxID=4733 RepID=UPI003C2EC647
MRPGAGFNATEVAAAAAPAVAGVAHSAWHSPVPYLFGGLAAMLGLIAFALLILACSYWKLSGYLGASGDRDGGSGAATPDEKPASMAAVVASYEEKVVVIMAGDEKPTFLATPISSRASSFGDHGNGEGDEKMKKKEVEEPRETRKETQDLDHSNNSHI